jgi:hypothetical protein
MTTTYDVRLWKTEVYEGKRGKTYYVRWGVAGKPRKEPFKSAALAKSFKADLVSAARKGEAFDIATGLPVSMKRATNEMSWYDFACAYVDLKWSGSAATTRRTVAEALTAVTTAMFADDRGKPDGKEIRHALTRWAFNTNLRDKAPVEVRRILKWIASHTRNVSALAEPDVMRSVLDSLSHRLDGMPAKPSVVGRRRRILNASCEYAVERNLLSRNPIPSLKWKVPKAVQVVDRRSVANPTQARTLLEAIRAQSRSGPRLVAYFGCLYFAALRPEEAASLRKHNLAIPEEDWGELHLEGAEPHAGKDWTDTGNNRDRRQLKQRAVGRAGPFLVHRS